MKLRLLLSIAAVTCACTASAALACDAHKDTKSASVKKAATKSTTFTAAAVKSGAACSAEMAAHCTPAMKAACASNATVAAAMGCETSKGVTTMNVVASASGRPAAKGGDCCATKAHRATTAVAAVATPGRTGVSAEHCAAGYAAHAAAMAHACAACENWISCEQDVRSLGAKAQVVPLKNGVMVVYTADSPGDVRVLQSLVAKRHDRMVSALAAGSSQKLCDECKQLRGAMASGKLNREVVNVERGCMTLMTSSDRVVVQKIRAMNGQPVAAR